MSMFGDMYEPLMPGDEPGAKQSMKDECDIDGIVMRYKATGLISHLAGGVPQFVDVGELGDFRSVLEHVRSVEAYFAGLPAEVRASFANDVYSYMDYLESDPSIEDMETRGLAALGDRRAVERLRRVDDVVVEAAGPPAPAGPPEAPVEPGTVDT